MWSCWYVNFMMYCNDNKLSTDQIDMYLLNQNIKAVHGYFLNRITSLIFESETDAALFLLKWS